MGDAGAHAIAVSEASDLLRPGLLEGTRVLVAGGSGPARVSEPASTTGSAGTTEPLVPLGIAVGEACVELGARVHTCDSGLADEAIVDEIVTAAVAELGSLDLLVVDGAGLFAQEGLRNCLDATWNFTRAVVNLAFLPSAHGGRIVYLAPAGGRDRFKEFASAARAGLENLGRTLSTEWARYGITLVTIAPGEATDAGEVAALCAYLASPAGAYFSGCLLDLRGP